MLEISGIFADMMKTQTKRNILALLMLVAQVGLAPVYAQELKAKVV